MIRVCMVAYTTTPWGSPPRRPPGGRGESRAAPERAGRTLRGHRSRPRSGPGSARSRRGPRRRRGQRDRGATTCGCPTRGPDRRPSGRRRGIAATRPHGQDGRRRTRGRAGGRGPAARERLIAGTVKRQCYLPAGGVGVRHLTGRPGGRRRGRRRCRRARGRCTRRPSHARRRPENQGTGPHRPPPAARGRRHAGRPDAPRSQRPRGGHPGVPRITSPPVPLPAPSAGRPVLSPRP